MIIVDCCLILLMIEPTLCVRVIHVYFTRAGKIQTGTVFSFSRQQKVAGYCRVMAADIVALA